MIDKKAMRKSWSRSTPVVSLGETELSRLLEPLFYKPAIEGYQYLEGGLTNTNIKVTVAESNQPLVVRVYMREGVHATREHRIDRLVAGRVPTARFLHAADSNPVSGHPYAIMEWVLGVLLEDAAEHWTGDEPRQTGYAAGEVLAGLHGITFDRTGFFDDRLKVSEPVDISKAGLVAYLTGNLTAEPARSRLGAELSDRVLAFAKKEGDILDQWSGRPCLAHSDFGGSNILLANSNEGWRVKAVLDWEFAFSGNPFFDFGNLLRSPLGDVQSFVEGVYDGYTDAGGRLPDNWRQISLLTDFTAWAEFLGRRKLAPALINHAKEVFCRTIDAWQ